MKANINTKRLNNMLAGIRKSINLFQAQGYTDVYFTAQFIKSGKKQNGLERGDINAFARQIRTYVNSEDADQVRIEFIDNSTGKSIYSKVLTDLRMSENAAGTAAQIHEANYQAGLSGYAGLGEAQVNALVDKRVGEVRMQDDFQRMSRELEDLRGRNSLLESEKEELEATLKAKKETEYYMSIIGAAFPGLATLFSGTPLAQAANFLAGTSDINGNALPSKAEIGEGHQEENHSLSAMVNEFCATLNEQEQSAIHMTFIAYEKDRNQIMRVANFLSQTPFTT